MSDDNLPSELYFLIAKFLKNSPCQETFEVLLKEASKYDILPKRIDWLGTSSNQTFEELEAKYKHINEDHILQICNKISSLLQTETKKNLSFVPSILGSGNQSVIRFKETKKKCFDTADYTFQRHCLPLCEPVSFHKHNFIKSMYGREVSGVFSRKHLLSGSTYKNMQLLGRTLGHLSAVYCVLFDSSSQYIITGADDLLVKIWHAVSGRLLATLRGASAEITDLAINYENTLLAAGSVDKIVRVWCLQTAYPIATLQIHTGLITGVNFCPSVVNGCRYLASTATDGSVAFWKYATNENGTTSFESTPVQYLERIRPGCAQILCGSFSSGGMFLATGSADHNVRIYKMAGLEGPVRVLEKEAHSDRVDSIQWAHTHLKFISGSKDGTSIIWFYEQQQWKSIMLVMSAKLPGSTVTEDDAKQKLRVTMLCWDKSDQWVVTASSDNSIKVWNSVNGELIQVLVGHKAETYVVECHPLDSRILLSAGHDGKIFLWNIITGEILSTYHNSIDGQGFGAVFDAKWSPNGTMFAATDSHGQILTFGFGVKDVTREVPVECFFHTDYRPLIRNSDNVVLDEQTQIPPHLMPPPFLVDIDGNPYPPYMQRLVPGREHCDTEQLVPNVVLSDEGRQEVIMEASLLNGIDNIAEQRRLNPSLRSRVGMRRSGDVEGVRQSSGNWQRGDIFWTKRDICTPLDKYSCITHAERIRSLAYLELDDYRRESKKPMLTESKPLCTTSQKLRRRRRKTLHSYRTRASRTEQLEMEFENPENLGLASTDSQDENEFTAPESDLNSSSSSDHESSSDYSDWTADNGINKLEPPKRTARIRNMRKVTRLTKSSAKKPTIVPEDIPEEFRPPDWLSETMPKKAPYYPQMGDEVMFFQQGYNLYLNAVQNKNIYKARPSQLNPWGKIKLKDPQLVKVIGIKYEIRPPRLCGLRLALMNEENQVTRHSFDLKYHDISDVIDFLVLRQVYDTAMSRNWKVGDRFRSVIDDAWWCGKIASRNRNAQSNFLCYRILWDNNEHENLSPWDLEPLNSRREPQNGSSIPVLPREMKNMLYHPTPEEWPNGDQDGTCDRIIRGIEDLMGMSIAEHFLVPVDFSIYPEYAYMIEYPIDLNTIKSRFENRFYRRLAAAQFDARYIASNAEKFNEPGSDIVKHARIITDILLKIIKAMLPLDVPALCHQLQENYNSADSMEETPHSPPSSRLRPHVSARTLRSVRYRNGNARSGFNWKQECKELLQLLWLSEDSEPFRQPVDRLEHPDYDKVIDTPMDLSIIREELRGDNYDTPQDFCKDVRIMFQNAKNYTPNKRSRIYAMTVRLSSLAEAHMKTILSHWRSLKKSKYTAVETENSGRSMRRRRAVKTTVVEDDSPSSDDDDDDDENQPCTSASAKRRYSARRETRRKTTKTRNSGRHAKQSRYLSKNKFGSDDGGNSTDSDRHQKSVAKDQNMVDDRRRNLRKRKMWNYAKMLESGSEVTDASSVAETSMTTRPARETTRKRSNRFCSDNSSDPGGQQQKVVAAAKDQMVGRRRNLRRRKTTWDYTKMLESGSDLTDDDDLVAGGTTASEVKSPKQTRTRRSTKRSGICYIEESKSGSDDNSSGSDRENVIIPKEQSVDRKRNLRKRKLWNYAKMLESGSELTNDDEDEPPDVKYRKCRSADKNYATVRRRLRRRQVQQHYVEDSESDDDGGDATADDDYDDDDYNTKPSVNISVSVSSRGRIRKLTAKAKAKVFRDSS